jgi:nodulation protein E
MPRRVAITGLGVVSAIGIGVPAFWDSLIAGRSGVRTLTGFEPGAAGHPIAAAVDTVDLEPRLLDDRQGLLDRATQFALIAGLEAMRDADISLAEDEQEDAGAVIGTALGGATSEDAQYERFYRQGITRAHPFCIPRIMYNAPASQLSMRLSLRGPTLCVSTACAAGTHAIGEAAEMIRSGRADVMLAGGSDAPLTGPVLKAWEAMRVLAPPHQGDAARACRPFSKDRQGMVIGEGAGVLVLESWDRAVGRGAHVHAELAGYGSTSDAAHITQPGIEAPARAIARALRAAGVRACDVQYVNAHGTGTRVNDAAETAVIKAAFGDHASRLVISATKAMHGHAMGASGALEAIATVLAVETGTVPPTINYTVPDPECDLDYAPLDARRVDIQSAVSNSFAFGGLNAVLVVKAVNKARSDYEAD